MANLQETSRLGNPEMYDTTEDDDDVSSARQNFDIRCLTMRALETQTSRQHPELGLHTLILLCSYTPVLRYLLKPAPPGAKTRMVPAAENQLGRRVAPLARDRDKNHEEGKVGQGAGMIDYGCRPI